MIIIQLRERMGNQMFQYALYLSLKHIGKKVLIHDEQKRIYGCSHCYESELKNVFNLSYDEASIEDLLPFFAKMFRESRNTIVTLEDPHVFSDEIFHLDDCFASGFWQSEKYFSNLEVKQQLKKDFSCPQHVFGAADFQYWYEQIMQKKSVGIFVRRGDYLSEKFRPAFGDICTEEYYERSINYILERIPDAHFFVFSDDKPYIREKFTGNQFTVVDNENMPYSYDFFLNSCCRHFIIANSTFSWWAAWLGGQRDSITIAPDKWLNTCAYEDIYTDDMIRISGEA